MVAGRNESTFSRDSSREGNAKSRRCYDTAKKMCCLTCSVLDNTQKKPHHPHLLGRRVVKQTNSVFSQVFESPLDGNTDPTNTLPIRLSMTMYYICLKNHKAALNIANTIISIDE